MLANSKKIRIAFFSKQVFLFDLDGTLYLGSKILPGARELLSKLRAENKSIYFFTNNSSRSENEYVEKLKKMGFEVKPEEVIMSTHSLIWFLNLKKMQQVFLLGTPAMEQMLKNSGIQNVSTGEGAQAVVVGFDKTLTYEKLKRACELIESGVPYIVTHPDLYCPTDKGREPDCGSFAAVLRLVTETDPIAVLGKPHSSMIEEVLRRSGASKKSMILTGDRLSTDILMARRAGIESLLVLSGETTKQKLRASRAKPRFVLDSVADLISV